MTEEGGASLRVDLRTVSFRAEERHLLLPSFSLIPGADPASWQKVTLQTGHQPAWWVQYVQTTSSGGQYPSLLQLTWCSQGFSKLEVKTRKISPDWIRQHLGDSDNFVVLVLVEPFLRASGAPSRESDSVFMVHQGQTRQIRSRSGCLKDRIGEFFSCQQKIVCLCCAKILLFLLQNVLCANYVFSSEDHISHVIVYYPKGF